jgi:iron complex outermembrane receptor protein
MLKKLLSVIMIFLATAAFVDAQTGTAVGTINDGDGLPLIGANVVVKGTTIGTITDVGGNYKLSGIPVGSKMLVSSFIGFGISEMPVEIVADREITVNFTLVEDITALDELVVIGYGTVKKSDATGAVVAISSDDFNQGAISTPDQLITGKVSGVQITSGGGAPGSGQTIRIRGGASLNASNDPLIVIDGLPLSTDGISGLANPLASINPNDIETMTVLKDASAAAIYGSRASNGVIIITTKKGKAGSAFKVEYTGSFSTYTIPKTIDVLSSQEFQDAVNNYAETTSPKNPDAITKYLGYTNSNNPDAPIMANTDWQKEIFETAYGTDHNIGFSGAYKNLPYRVSLGYFNQDGILKTGSMDRSSINVTLNPTFFDDYLKVNVNAKYASINNQFANTGAIGAAIQMDPTKPVYNENGDYWYWGLEQGKLTSTGTNNPVALLELTDDQSTVDRMTGNIQFDYKFHFFPDLKANLNLGYDGSNSDGTKIESAKAPWQYSSRGSGMFRSYSQEKENKLLDLYLQYNKDLKNIDSYVDAMGGYSYQSFYKSDYLFIRSVENNPTTGIPDTLNPENYTPTEYVLLSFFGRMNYHFKDRYLVTVTLRNDQSSRFSKETRSGLFPSFAFAWNLKKEDWMSGVAGLSQLKLRAGYGVTGQQSITDNDYPYQANYLLSQANASYLFGNQYYKAYRPDEYDANIKWEETSTTNLAIDYGIFNDRINGSLDFYRKESKDLINEIPIPAGSNFSNYLLTNVGDLENKGVEFNIVGRPISTPDILWEVGFNCTYNQNEITKLTAYDNPEYLGVFTGDISGGVGSKVQIHSVGYPANSYFVYQQVYNDNGKPIEGLYVDKNEDGQIDDNDRYQYKDPNADFYFGLSSRLNYKAWTFSFAGRAQFNNYVYNNVSSNDGELSRLYRPEGPYLSNIVSSATDAMFYTPRYLSDYYVQNGSFFRMDNITLSYLFKGLAKDKIDLSITGTINNTFVITKYKGLDPEVNDGKNPGIDNNIYPRPRVFMLGVNLQF